MSRPKRTFLTTLDHETFSVIWNELVKTSILVTDNNYNVGDYLIITEQLFNRKMYATIHAIGKACPNDYKILAVEINNKVGKR